MNLKDKVAIITGGGSGIGAATAQLFAKEGARVVVVDVKDTGAKISKNIKASSGEALFIKADVAEAKSIQRMVQKTIDHYGKIDILHNHAGILIVGDVMSLEESDWDRSINTNLKSVYLVSKYVIPHFVKHGGGVIINTASSAGLCPGRGYSAYSTSKAAIIMLTKCMALDFASLNIRVNCICPGPTDTPLFMPKDLLEHKKQKIKWGQELPIGRMGNPEDIAKAVLFLASDESSFATGTALVVDGGRSLVGIGSRIAGGRIKEKSK